jgi:hypothetical protein
MNMIGLWTILGMISIVSGALMMCGIDEMDIQANIKRPKKGFIFDIFPSAIGASMLVVVGAMIVLQCAFSGGLFGPNSIHLINL